MQKAPKSQGNAAELLFTLGLYSNFALATGEGAQSFTLDGQLFSDTTSTTPLLDANAALTLQILDASQTCILYEESQTVNTSATNGYFNIQVGAATAAGKRGANDQQRDGNCLFQFGYQCFWQTCLQWRSLHLLARSR